MLHRNISWRDQGLPGLKRLLLVWRVFQVRAITWVTVQRRGKGGKGFTPDRMKCQLRDRGGFYYGARKPESGAVKYSCTEGLSLLSGENRSNFLRGLSYQDFCYSVDYVLNALGMLFNNYHLVWLRTTHRTMCRFWSHQAVHRFLPDPFLHPFRNVGINSFHLSR